MSQIQLIPATTPAQLAELVELFVEYQHWLDVDLGFQQFDRELTSLPGDYAPPRGCLLLAREPAGPVAGAVGLRPLDDEVCEMKRLFVRPGWRGRGLGRRLAVAVVTAARNAGFRLMRLDTLEQLTQGLALYRSLGFTRIEPYRYNPLPHVVYLELDLKQL